MSDFSAMNIPVCLILKYPLILDILAAYSLTSKAQPRSQSPWRAEAEGRTTPRAEPPKPQTRNNIGATESKQKQKIPIK